MSNTDNNGRAAADAERVRPAPPEPARRGPGAMAAERNGRSAEGAGAKGGESNGAGSSGPLGETAGMAESEDAGTARSREGFGRERRDRNRFAILNAARRVWAVASVHGDLERLERLHEALWSRLEAGDRLVYLGNMIGHQPATLETLDCLLAFRRAFLSRPLTFAADIAYLRGAQEEMWQKLLQLQFANAPLEVLGWMVEQGLGPTLDAYGSSVAEARHEATAGAVALTRWTSRLRAAMQSRRGHTDLFSALRRAAFTADREAEGGLLFVNTGLDPSRPLETQNDSFWWSSAAFQQIVEPYGGYARVVRGFSPSHPGIEIGACTATVDAGCGLGGPLLAACFDRSGALLDQLSA